MSGCQSGVLWTKAHLFTEENATQALYIVFYLLGRMKSFLGDLAGFFLLDQTLVANDGFMADGGTQIVKRAPAGKELAGLLLMLGQGLANDPLRDMEQ